MYCVLVNEVQALTMMYLNTILRVLYVQLWASFLSVYLYGRHTHTHTYTKTHIYNSLPTIYLWISNFTTPQYEIISKKYNRRKKYKEIDLIKGFFRGWETWKGKNAAERTENGMLVRGKICDFWLRDIYVNKASRERRAHRTGLSVGLDAAVCWLATYFIHAFITCVIK